MQNFVLQDDLTNGIPRKCPGDGDGGLRVKQVRFGKLAFPQLNGAFFGPKNVILGHFALRFQ